MNRKSKPHDLLAGAYRKISRIDVMNVPHDLDEIAATEICTKRSCEMRQIIKY